jgi:hypothetical protein
MRTDQASIGRYGWLARQVWALRTPGRLFLINAQQPQISSGQFVPFKVQSQHMIRSQRRQIGQLSMILLIVPFCQGCDEGKPHVDTSKNEATVSGTVKIRGKPAEGGTILFNGSNSERIVEHRTAPIGKDGTYTVKTYVGLNQVTFGGEVAAENRAIGLIHEAAEVQPGENHADFDLLSGRGKGDGATGDNLPFPVPEKGKSKRKSGR